MNFLFDWDGEDQGNKLDDSGTSSSERENEEDNLMVNMLPLDKTYEEPTPLLQDRQKKKKKRTKGPINSLETAIDENNYDNYIPSIPKNSTESKIATAPYSWEKSAVSSGCPNAANARKRAVHPEKGCGNNTSIIEIWKQFIAMEIVNLIPHYTNLKILSVLRYIRSGKKAILCTHN